MVFKKAECDDIRLFCVLDRWLRSYDHKGNWRKVFHWFKRGIMAKSLTKTEKAAQIMRVLDDLYPNPPIPLDHSSHYTLWGAVLLSAHCTEHWAHNNTATNSV